MPFLVRGGEIPIGEAMDGTLAMAKEIIRNYDEMLPAGGELVAAANSVYELPLPEECKAENCDTDCWMSYEKNCWGECGEVTVFETKCAMGSCPGETCNVECDDFERVCLAGVPCPAGALHCDCASIPGTCCWDDPITCDCGPPGSCDPASPFCHKIMDDPETWCWGPDNCDTNCQEVCTPPADAFCQWFGARCCCTTSELKDACKCGDACPPGEPFCFDVGSQTKCWGDNECFDKAIGGACEEKCDEQFDCGIAPCVGDACPADAINELASLNVIIGARASKIARHADAIKAEVAKAPGLRDLLEQARLGLKMCTTPASGYQPSEAVQKVLTLVSCSEAKWFKMLSEDQEDCYSSNFFCCKPKE